MKFLIFIGFVSLLCTSVSYAEESDYSRQYSMCMERAGGVTLNMLDCFRAETKRQDARLNSAYQQTMASLTATRKKQLQDVQRLWIRYRDANCGFYADPDGGSMAGLNSSSCYLDATASRATELENLREEY
ncbi:DUF1311 domain-containing protein [Acinetobacter cumulans]|uniref:DUF1311 domain-containing protein n=1 Tax=Acinetobacter cumulans TaxID=2136182 RepID=A0A3A8FQA0_9GAMM|nr:lysozyme inhibitor LprI family protein [Acinetobacter cumulans]RKG48518.1 DUF1311 domain-containing protein [Acinetobacter cumulans]